MCSKKAGAEEDAMEAISSENAETVDDVDVETMDAIPCGTTRMDDGAAEDVFCSCVCACICIVTVGELSYRPGGPVSLAG